MAVVHDRLAPLGPHSSDPQVGDVLGEIAAAVAYLERLSESLHVGVLPGEGDAAAIPPSTLIAVRRSCQRVRRHSGRALAAMSPRRAEQADAVAAQVREVELLRFRYRDR
jgi:hypothetical protein